MSCCGGCATDAVVPAKPKTKLNRKHLDEVEAHYMVKRLGVSEARYKELMKMTNNNLNLLLFFAMKGHNLNNPNIHYFFQPSRSYVCSSPGSIDSKSSQ
jgi:hypothetical protein